MKKMLKPVCLGFYALMTLTFFILGLYYAGWIEAGKNQGLAGGAIVLGWGVMFGLTAFVASLFIARYVPLRTLKKVNWGLLAFCFVIIGYTYLKYQQRNSLKEENIQEIDETPRTPTAPIGAFPMHIKTTIAGEPNGQKGEGEMGMGYFSPNFFEHQVLYFYRDPNLEKSFMEHLPFDSITFERNKYNQFQIATAPPWLVPEVMKLDYDMLFFRIKSVTEDFAEIIVNTETNLTSFVNRNSGRIEFWPDFLLKVNSVEFMPNSKEVVRVRPFTESSANGAEHQYMRPIRIMGDWMEVLLLNTGFKVAGKGWIQWKRENQILIEYNLLS